ncbi:sulfatase [Paenibacillus sp.]|uniref:sulfatase family protein n=1 Tax=Paenibacillus sp. TaxID=58172 RepID=UPI002D30D311|nr:sulfatase [Paenibacillus sp.]HZG85411.1 sulfatase [Paenibacillus sp.]
MNQPNKTNVLWILVDQMRAQAMSHLGDPNVNTPNLDRLAVEGVEFTQAVSGTPLCTPFRGAMLTGRYPHRSSVPGLNSPLSTEMPTLAHAFADHGYKTCWIGKWHLDGDRPELDLTLEVNKKDKRIIPKERRAGFEDWWAYENNNQPFHCWVHGEQDGRTVSYRLPRYETDALTDILIDWLRNYAAGGEARPFFASLSVQPPHDPYVAPAETMKNYNPAALQLRPNVPNIPNVTDRTREELAGYYAAIERIDWNVGRIRETLLELGLDQNTQIMFFSDHGDLHGSHGQFRKQAPWEESIRIPFIVGGPTRKSYKTKKLDFPINHVDIAPTTLGLCGIRKPEGMDGTDYSAFILNESAVQQDVPDSAYLSLPIPTSNLKGIILEEGVDRPFRGIVTRDGWKYIVLENQPWLMFHLKEDPYELVNLAHNVFYKEKRRELQQRLAEWIRETGDTFALPDVG